MGGILFGSPCTLSSVGRGRSVGGTLISALQDYNVSAYSSDARGVAQTYPITPPCTSDAVQQKPMLIVTMVAKRFEPCTNHRGDSATIEAYLLSRKSVVWFR